MGGTARKPEHKILAVLVVAAFGAILAPDVSADRITTTSGQTFTGKILEETAESVVIQTMSGTFPVPRATINTIEKEGGAEAAKIVPAVVDPAKAPEAFEEAKTAVAAGDWVRAGNLLEGLLRLDSGSFPQENRLAASAALVTCYLQIKDAKGAAVALRLRANLVASETDKKRLIAPAEALEASGTPAIGDITVGRYEEAIEVGTEWKARQILELAKQLGAGATGLNAMDRLERSARTALEKLDEADLYVPGFAKAYRTEVLTTLADNIMDAVRRAVEICTEDRKDLSRYWQTSAYGTKAAMEWNEKASRYLAIRQAAEDGLKNLKPFGDKYETPDLYKEREQTVTDLLAKLDDLKYHEKRQGMKERYRIALRKIGGN
ncbi:MAG: hypothetical protein WBD75_02265 [Phycisphaerae bacterium]